MFAKTLQYIKNTGDDVVGSNLATKIIIDYTWLASAGLRYIKFLQ